MARVNEFFPNTSRRSRATRKGANAVATRAWGVNASKKVPGDIKEV